MKTFDGKALPSIEVGKNAPVGFNAYVKMSNSPAVLLTSSVFPTGMNKTVNDLIGEAAIQMREKIDVRRFARYQLGEALDGKATTAAS